MYLIFAILIIGGIAVYKFFPPYYANYTFQDALKNELVRMHNAQKTDDEMRSDILRLAQSNELPISEKQIRITHVNRTISVDVNYQVHVDMPGYPVDLDFSPSASNTLP